MYDNVAFPLELQGMSKAEIKERIEPILDIVGLTERREMQQFQENRLVNMKILRKNTEK